MPFLSEINKLRVLIIDQDDNGSRRLAECLQDHGKLVYSVNTENSLDAAMRVLGDVEVSTIFIDPLSMGIEAANKFVFDARQKMPWIVFVLYIEPTLVRNNADFYTGDRRRWKHYFTLSKTCDCEEFKENVYLTIHLCLSDIRLADSQTRSRLQKEFVSQSGPPVEIQESLALFRQKFSHSQKTAFIMMQFGNTSAHSKISDTLKEVLGEFGVMALRADDWEFHSDLFYNVLTYIYGCDFGIAVFERITEDNFNPNVSLEVGYAMALRKPICLLKDQNLKTLHADLVGKLYRPFDQLNLRKSMGAAMKRWMVDRAFALGNHVSEDT